MPTIDVHTLHTYATYSNPLIFYKNAGIQINRAYRQVNVEEIFWHKTRMKFTKIMKRKD